MGDFEKDFEQVLGSIDLELPPEDLPEVRSRVIEAAREAGEDLLDEKELERRHKELWGFREVARFLGISWKTARKWGKEGRLPILPESEWSKGPVTMYRKHFKNTPFGPEYTHTTEEVRIVDLVFDAATIQNVDVEKIRDHLVFEWMDENKEAIGALIEKVRQRMTRITEEGEVIHPKEKHVHNRVIRELRGHGVTKGRFHAWLAGDKS